MSLNSFWMPESDEDQRRKAEIEEMMRSERARYFRDEPVQQEYRDILTRAADRSAAAAKPVRVAGPFDEALARFKERRAEGAESRITIDGPFPMSVSEREGAKFRELNSVRPVPSDLSASRTPDLPPFITQGGDEFENDTRLRLAAAGRFFNFNPTAGRNSLPRAPKQNVPLDEKSLPTTTAPATARPLSDSVTAFSRIGRDDVGPMFDRAVKWGDTKSVAELPAYTRDVASTLSQGNPKSGIPRFLFRLDPLHKKTAGRVGAVDGELARAAERSMDISSFVVDKLYAKAKIAGDKALAELPNLLENGEVYPTNPREGGRRRVAIVAPWGSAGDKLLTVLEVGSSGESAEIVSIHPMQKKMFENRLRKTGALSIGASAILTLGDDDDGE